MTWMSHIVLNLKVLSRYLASWISANELLPTNSRVASGKDPSSRLIALLKPHLVKVAVIQDSVSLRTWSALTYTTYSVI